MTAKQISGLQAPDGSTYITLTDGNGNLSSLSQGGLGTGVSSALAANTNTSGGIATVAVGATSWTPTDKSADALTFTSVNAQYTQIGNMVYAYGTLTYPVITTANAASITLPVAVPNQTYAIAVGCPMSNVAAYLKTVPGTTTATVITAQYAAVTNSTLNGKVLTFIVTYPAS